MVVELIREGTSPPCFTSWVMHLQQQNTVKMLDISCNSVLICIVDFHSNSVYKVLLYLVRLYLVRVHVQFIYIYIYHDLWKYQGERGVFYHMNDVEVTQTVDCVWQVTTAQTSIHVMVEFIIIKPLYLTPLTQWNIPDSPPFSPPIIMHASWKLAKLCSPHIVMIQHSIIIHTWRKLTEWGWCHKIPKPTGWSLFWWGCGI